MIDTSVADPAPLGLAAFALTTFVLSCCNAGLIGKGGDFVVLGVALAYGGAAQFAAGMWEYKRNNVFGATAFTSYGAFWISFALLVTFYVGKLPPETVPAAIGTFLLAWGIFSIYMTLGAAKVSVPLLVVFVLLDITFLLLAFGAYAGMSGLSHLGGYFGIATAVAAWYTAAKGMLAQMR
ncbi:MAG: acetate uptake transporter [Candidatus Velthaea sp.]